eukprot:TRINITY_DN37748_c0_g1_i1.p1 TRINITY_DN37748_c0_g1~~TRINITY_DN37748_c0_g1_i1.p1  ORF type:complete len:112 (-),score=8.59 TRINITY_DN37748_c0_g1_i1:27-362(-)
MEKLCPQCSLVLQETRLLVIVVPRRSLERCQLVEQVLLLLKHLLLIPASCFECGLVKPLPFLSVTLNLGLPLGNHTLLGLSLIHISEPTRLLSISYAVFCLKKKQDTKTLI